MGEPFTIRAGDFGESIVTSGGDRTGECGPIDSGLFGVAGRESTFSSSEAMFECSCPGWNAGRVWSSDMRPAGLTSPNRAVLLVNGDGLGGGGGGGFDFIMLSKWLRRDETGFWKC
jgi:hypothetical protein